MSGVPLGGPDADALLAQGRLDDAIRAYRKAIRREPRSAWLHQGLAVAMERKGWRISARSLHWRALELDPHAARRWHEAHPLGLVSERAIPDPVFVLGCPHSGTTILARLLGSHPSMMNAERGETHLFTRPPAEIGPTLERWDRACIAAGKKRWVEKSVNHSFCVPWLIGAYPRARFVISLRDGRDVFCSLLTRRGEYRSPDALIDQWIYINLAVLEYGDDPRFLLVWYEELSGEPEATLRRVCRHVGEDYSPAMLDYHREPIDWNAIQPPGALEEPKDRRAHRALRTWQINQPFFDGRHRWRSEMTPEDKQRFKRRARRHLAAWGYSQDESW
jgi:tetratricopeptide (TPR) repeat protein